MISKEAKARHRAAMRPKNTKKAFVARVKRIIAKNEETKYVAEQLLDSQLASPVPNPYVNFNSPINTQADWYRCLPLLTQGDDGYQRIGNQVKPTTVKLHLHFSFSPSVLDTNCRDIFVVLYVLKARAQNAYPTTTPGGALTTNYATYLDNGDGTDTYFALQCDAVKPINKDAVVLKAKRVIRLFKPFGVQNTNTTGSTVVAADAKYCADTTITWKIKKPLKYDTKTATVPTNFADCWAAGYYYSDGSSADTRGGLLRVTARTEMWYKDD